MMARRFTTPFWPAPSSKSLDSLMEEYTSRLEKRVAEESRFFRMMADAMPQIVWTAQPNGKTDYFNQRWYEFTGLSEEVSLKDGWMAAIFPDDHGEVKKHWNKSLRSGTPFEGELRFNDPQTNGFRWYLVRALPGRSNNGKTIKWFGTCTDIDEHKRAQANKDEFIAITSHELKTPLTSMKAFSQLLSFQLEEAGQQNLISIVGKMNQQIDRLNNLISDLLAISLLDSGKLKFHKSRFNFDKFVKDVVSNLQMINENHRLVLRGKSGKYLYADRDRLEQALTNLISNGVKYSPNADKIIISVNQSGDSAKVSVKDFGLGIPKQAQASVFERFFRVSGPKYESFSGFGLGLYIASEIIKKEGGRIWVKSQVGKGSTFSFSLPTSRRAKA